MKNIAFTSRNILFPVILGFCLTVNLIFLFKQPHWSWRIFHRFHRLTLNEKYAALYPAFFSDILAIRKQVPEDADIWLVSPADAWHINYYLYPRIIRFGSANLDDLDKERRSHPKGWVLIHQNLDPQRDRVKVFPPFESVVSND